MGIRCQRRRMAQGYGVRGELAVQQYVCVGGEVDGG